MSFYERLKSDEKDLRDGWCMSFDVRNPVNFATVIILIEKYNLTKFGLDPNDDEGNWIYLHI